MYKKIILVLIIVLLLCGCEKKKIHSNEELMEYLNNLTCYEDNCNLKNNYTIIDEKIYKDDNDKDVRELTVKPNNYDFEFIVKSEYKCTGVFSASCFKWGYDESTDYNEKANIYFRNQYSKYFNDACNIIYDSIISCDIINNNSVEQIDSSINGYLNYLSKQVIKINNHEIWFNLPSKNKNGSKTLKINIVVNDGKYNLYYRGKVYDENTGSTTEKRIIIKDIKKYLLNYCNDNNIKLEDNL